MRVVVTGATGNVGSGVVAALRRDPEVTSIVGVARRLPQEPQDGVEWRALDVTTDVTDVMTGADAVIHLAWLLQPDRDPRLLRRVNVEGTRNVVQAAVAAGVPAVAVASSVGTYAEGPKEEAVEESWPATGIRSSLYSRQKAEVEMVLDGIGRPPGTTIARLRTSLVFSERAASEIGRLFLGPLVPLPVLGRGWLPVVPRHPRLAFQATHTDDIGEAYRSAVKSRCHGPVNVAADPVLDGPALGAILGSPTVPVPAALLRRGAGLTHALRLQPTSSGWVDLALGVPTMDCERARRELGWDPAASATAAVEALLAGFRARAGAGTAPLAPAPGGTTTGPPDPAHRPSADHDHHHDQDHDQDQDQDHEESP